MSKSKNYTFGFFSGAVLGSIIALLYAPDTGRNTRNIVSYRLSNYVDELSNIIEELTAKNRIMSDAKKQGDQVVENARKRAEDLINEAESLLNSIEETKKSAQNGIKR